MREREVRERRSERDEDEDETKPEMIYTNIPYAVGYGGLVL